MEEEKRLNLAVDLNDYLWRKSYDLSLCNPYSSKPKDRLNYVDVIK